MNKNSYTYLDAPFTVKDKWTRAVLIPENGNSYYAGVKLKFSSQIDLERIKLANIAVLSHVRILSSKMEIIDDKLVMCLPSESYIKERLSSELDLEKQVSDQEFVTPNLSPFQDGLKLNYQWDGENHCFLIGFWTFTCDGLSIDLIINAIIDYYEKGEFNTLYDENQLLNIDKRSEELNFVFNSEHLKNESLAYSFTTIENDLVSKKSKTVNIDFDILKSEIRRITRVLGVTEFTIMLALFQISISEISELSNVITGVPFVNRYSLREFCTVGPFANTIPVFTSYPKSAKLIDKIFITQEALLDASKRQMKNYSILPNRNNRKLYNQIFNAWNSKVENKKMNLYDGNSLCVEMIHNGTVRSDLDITIGTTRNGEIFGKFGFCCESSEFVTALIKSMKQKLIILKTCDTKSKRKIP